MPAGRPVGLAVFNDGRRGESSMTAAVASGLRDISFFMVAQHLAGGLVDEMDPGTGRAGHGFIAVRVIGRCHFGHLDLNIHAGPCAAKYQFDHF